MKGLCFANLKHYYDQIHETGTETRIIYLRHENKDNFIISAPGMRVSAFW